MSDSIVKYKKRKPKEKALTPFAKGTIIYALCLASLLAVLIGILAFFLHTYEKNLPENTAEKFVSGLDRNALSLLVKDAAGELGEFEDPMVLIDRTEHFSGDIRYAKLAKEYTAASPVYRLICGNQDIGKFTLKRSEKNAAFGIARYEIQSAVLYAESVPGAIARTSAWVCLPSGAELYVNGKTAGKEYMRESSVLYSGKTIVPKDTLCDIYLIEGLCTEPELEAVFGDKRLSLALIGGKSDWFSERENTFTLTIPSDSYVTIDGSEPSPSLSIPGELNEAVSEFEKHLGDALPKMISYTVCGNKDNTKIYVSVNGKSLESTWFKNEGKEEAVFLYSDESKFAVSAVVPRGSVLYINGVPVSESYGKAEKIYEGLEGVRYLAGDQNKLMGVHFEVKGLLCIPEITAKMGEKEIPICSLSRNEQTFFAEFYGEASDNISGVKNAADAFARSYFHYMANGAVGLEENYNALISQMKSGSPAHKHIWQSKVSIGFVNQGVYRIDLISPHDFIKLGNDLTYCRVDFSVNLRFYRNEKQYEGWIDLIFSKENGEYKVCNMIINSES